MKIINAMLVSVLALIPAQASALTGAELYHFCAESNKSTLHETTCLAYIRGFIDGMTLQVVADAQGIKVCFPDDGVTPTQGRLIFEKAARDHPKVLSEKAGIVFWGAMAAAFSCSPN